MKYVIVDCDPGIDDALALHVLARMARRGEIEILGITTLAGNVPLEYTARNAAFVSAELGGLAPVFLGAAGPLQGSVRAEAGDYHGSDGLGGLYRSGHAPPSTQNAIEWLVETVRDLSTRGISPTVLAVGPLTNIALALEAEPRLPSLVENTIIMGGAVTTPGNITRHGEFNFFCDPEAAAAVFRSGLRIDLVPLDVTEQVLITTHDVDEMESRLGGASPGTGLLRASIEFYRKMDGRDGCIMHDALAAATITEPDIIGWQEMSIAVVTEGVERGRSIESAEGGRCRVARRVDAEWARRAILDAVAEIGTQAMTR